MIFKRCQVLLEDKNIRVWAACGSEDVVSAIWAEGFAIDSSEGCVFRLDCGYSSLLDRLLSQSVP